MTSEWYERTGIFSQTQFDRLREAGIEISTDPDMMLGIPWTGGGGKTRYIPLRRDEVRARMRIPRGMSQVGYMRQQLSRLANQLLSEDV